MQAIDQAHVSTRGQIHLLPRIPKSARHYYFQDLMMATRLIDRLVILYCLGDIASIARHGTFFYHALSGSIAF